MKNEEDIKNITTSEVSKPNIETKDELIKLIQNDFASGITMVYVNSLGKEIGFKEVSAHQQKILSRVMIGNEHRKDVIYDAQCATINNSALADGFDIYSLTEFDRLKILIALYQSNMFSNDVKFTCKNCGTENKYQLNFDNVIERLDEIGLEPRKFEYENKKFKYEFTIQYPQVKRISSFYKSYCAKHTNHSKRDVAVNDNMSNMEYVELFISNVKFTIKANNVTRDIDFSKYKASDVQDILANFPQDALYTENGVLNFIANEYLKKINDSFDKHECYSCGTIQEEEGANQAESFL